MYLVAVEGEDTPIQEARSDVPVYAQWANFPVSYFSHHGLACCESARLWLRNSDFAQLNGSDLASGPRWIRKQYEWGPSAWPLYWCEALNSEVVDCGAHSALAHEAFKARGVTAFRAQLIQSYGPKATDQWRTRWDAQDISVHWLGDRCIYHEGNAVLIGDNEVKLWDGSAGHWLNPTQTCGYGSLLAVRIATHGEFTDPFPLRWGAHVIMPDVWQAVGAGAKVPA